MNIRIARISEMKCSHRHTNPLFTTPTWKTLKASSSLSFRYQSTDMKQQLERSCMKIATVISFASNRRVKSKLPIQRYGALSYKTMKCCTMLGKAVSGYQRQYSHLHMWHSDCHLMAFPHFQPCFLWCVHWCWLEVICSTINPVQCCFYSSFKLPVSKYNEIRGKKLAQCCTV